MKILVVDDHAYNRELLGFMLEDYNHETCFAKHGKEAVDIVSEDESIDLVLMDVMMPVMDGMEATRLIKDKCAGRFLPVLFVTALDNEENVTKCLESGGDDFVPKPINENILVAKVNAHTRSKELYDKLKSANDELQYHRKTVDREHAIVEHIYNNASSRVRTACDNIKVYSSPASMFNGDLVLVAPSPSGGVYCLIGDFTGHGLAASMGSLPVTEIFFQHVGRQASVSEIAREINHRLKELLPDNMFFCAGLFEIGYKGDSMTLWLGGMNDLLIVSPTSESLKHVESAHMPMGILSDEEFEDSPSLIKLEEGSRVYVYTDGITEAFNAENEEYGQDRLESALLKHSKNTIQCVIDEVNDFAHEGEQSDDVSLIEFHVGKLVHRDKKTLDEIDVSEYYHKTKSMPWQFSMVLKDDDLKSTSVVDQVMDFVSSIKGIELHQDKIFIIVSELYNNSLEHGVLGLDSSLKSSADGFETYYKLRSERLADIENQSISISFNFEKGDPNTLVLEMEDSGKGFDCESLQGASDSDEQAHGRGMSLLRELCSELTYSNGGRKVTASYELRRH